MAQVDQTAQASRVRGRLRIDIGSPLDERDDCSTVCDEYLRFQASGAAQRVRDQAAGFGPLE
jgi:hypothetical protein